MTADQACGRYNIPMEVLKEYDSLDLRRKSDSCEYDESDIERLSLFMTLSDLGFSKEEAKRYMELSEKSNENRGELTLMLRKKRNCTLDEIHSTQDKLDRLDYLLFELSRGDKI